MGQSLFVIEASGKVGTFRSLLDKLGRTRDKVFATGGRLFDLPEDALGLDPASLEPVDWIPNRPLVVDALAQAFAEADEVWLATDDDIEGEVIAFHAAHVARGKSCKLHRIHLQALTAQALRSAIEAPGALDMDRVHTGMARRSLDRIIGYALEVDESGRPPLGRIGRVVTPLVATAVRSDPVVGHLQHQWPTTDGRWLSMTVPVRRSGLDDARELRDRLAATPCPPAAAQTTESTPCPAPMAWDGGEALLHISDRLDQPVRDVAQGLQRLYESGRMSYARSDSRRLSEAAIRPVARIAAEHNITFDRDDMLRRHARDERERVQGAHEAPHPLCEVPLHVDPASLSFEDRILHTLTLHLIESGRGPSMMHTLSADLGGHLSRRARELMVKLGAEPVWSANFRQWPDSARAQAFDPVFCPGMELGQPSPRQKPRIDFRPVAIDRALLQMMLEEGLGRPSSYAVHAEKVSNRFFSGLLVPNGHAHAAIALAERIVPALLDPARARRAEAALADRPAGADRVSGRIMAALAQLGIGKADLKSRAYQSARVRTANSGAEL